MAGRCYLGYIASILALHPMNKGGVLDFYTGGTEKLFPDMEKDPFTYQMSDHLPLWTQINTDNDAFQIDQIIKVKKKDQ
jgi:hypothetical protein